MTIDQPQQGLLSSGFIRMAGLLYLIIIVSGLFSELWARSSLIEPEDAMQTLSNIRMAPSLFLSGLVADTIMLMCDVGLAIMLFWLFRPVNPTLSLAAMVFRLVQASVLSANLLNYVSAMEQVRNLSEASGLNNTEVALRVLRSLEMYAYGYDLGLIFFAVSNLLLGYLIIRSSRIPSMLGYGLQAAALVYLMGSYVRFLAPEVMSIIEPFYIIPVVAELSFCLWLLFFRKTGDHKTA